MRKLFHSRIPVLAMAFALVAGVALVTPDSAEARPRGIRGFGGFRAPAFSPYIGFYGFYGFPYAYAHPGLYGPREGGIDRNVARLQGWGAIDLNVKPKKAEVWVDGQYVGTAADFDGYPAYLWLDEGVHTVTIYRGGYESQERKVEIRRGQVMTMKLKMQPGESQPPGTK